MNGTGALYVAAGLAWLAVVYKSLAFRRPRETASAIFLLTLIMAAAAVTILLPPIYVAVDRLMGIPNLARLLANGSILLASWGVQLFMWRLNYPDRPLMPRVLSSGLLALTILVAMSVLFTIAPTDGEEAIDFTSRYAHEPAIQLYRFAFLAYLALTAIQFIHLSWRYASVTSSAILVPSLLLLTLGASCGLVYIVHEASRLLFPLLGLTYPIPDATHVTMRLLAVALVLMIVGSTLPTWGEYVGAARLGRWFVAYRTYRQLYPLWRAIYHALPTIALHPPRRDYPLADAMATKFPFLNYRRGIEIRDGYVRLQGHRDRRVRGYATALCRRARIPSGEAALILEAAEVAAALRAYRLDLDRFTTNEPLPIADYETFEEDAAHLASVARHFARSPIVRATLARLDREDREMQQAPHPAHR